jgi:EAL and modified HD-GYP domain-containing signal transduction protein
VNDCISPLIEVADIIKVCMKSVPSERLPQLTQQLRPYQRRLLAEKVETSEQLAYCTELGFELFQGYYFAKPTVLAGKKIHHSRLALLRLLTQMQRDDDTAELEKTFKHEPGLSVNLLRLTNSAAAGLRTKITSLRHAITLVGRSQLQRWVQLLLYTDFDGNNATPLLQMAATRARLMELLAGHFKPGDRDYADRAFMTGIMSLTPTLLGLPIQEILNQLAILPQDIQEALLVRSGTLGALLSIAELLDGEESPDQLPPLLDRLPGITLDSITDSLAKALDWAHNLNKEQL